MGGALPLERRDGGDRFCFDRFAFAVDRVVPVTPNSRDFHAAREAGAARYYYTSNTHRLRTCRASSGHGRGKWRSVPFQGAAAGLLEKSTSVQGTGSLSS